MTPVVLAHSRQVPLFLYHPHSEPLRVHLSILGRVKGQPRGSRIRTRSRSTMNFPNSPHLPARPAISESSRSISLESTVSSSKSAPFCAATRAACTSVNWKEDIRSSNQTANWDALHLPLHLTFFFPTRNGIINNPVALLHELSNDWDHLTLPIILLHNRLVMVHNKSYALE